MSPEGQLVYMVTPGVYRACAVPLDPGEPLTDSLLARLRAAATVFSVGDSTKTVDIELRSR
jgi:hypothetical protein